MRIHAAGVLYFDAVWRAGSIREAARRLNVASSAVNRQILKLEDEIGTPLFERFAGGVKLTAAGEALARHVIVVLQDMERAKTDIEGLRGARIGHVSIAAVEGVCAALLPEVIGRLRTTAPRVTLSANTMGSMAIPAALVQGEADVGVAFALPRQPELRQVAVGRFRLGAIMPPDHPLAARRTVSFAACLDFPLILAEAGLSVQALLLPVMARLPRPVQPVITSGSIELMRELAERGIGLAFQTRIGIEARIRAGKLVHVPIDAGGPVWSDLGIYVRAGRSLPATLDLVLQALTDELDRRETTEREEHA
jgi:DNA-binding transcriptional LysR family regulator